MIEQGIYQRLTADAGYSAILGDCLYPVILPDDAAYPCATFQVISATVEYALDGTVGEARKRIQFDHWSPDYGVVKQLQSALHEALEGFTGPLSDGTVVTGVFRELEIDHYEQFSRSHRATTEYLFCYIEPGSTT